MIDLGEGLEELETVQTEEISALCFTIEPSGVLPEVEKAEEDETLELPAYEGPNDSTPDPESIETEHELSDRQRRELMELIRTFELTSTVNLGRTHLIEHEITLKEGAIPRNPPVCKCSPYIQAAVNAEV